MPAKAAWLQRIPEIIEVLDAWSVPVIDRATCEKLFCVRRRRAIALLQYFGIGSFSSGISQVHNQAD